MCFFKRFNPLIIVYDFELISFMIEMKHYSAILIIKIAEHQQILQTIVVTRTPTFAFQNDAQKR